MWVLRRPAGAPTPTNSVRHGAEPEPRAPPDWACQNPACRFQCNEARAAACRLCGRARSPGRALLEACRLPAAGEAVLRAALRLTATVLGVCSGAAAGAVVRRKAEEGLVQNLGVGAYVGVVTVLHALDTSRGPPPPPEGALEAHLAETHRKLRALEANFLAMLDLPGDVLLDLALLQAREALDRHGLLRVELVGKLVPATARPEPRVRALRAEVQLAEPADADGREPEGEGPPRGPAPASPPAWLAASLRRFKDVRHDLRGVVACPVCLEDFNGAGKAPTTLRELPCKHLFHAGCIDRWLRDSPRCPVCREDCFATPPPRCTPATAPLAA